MMTHIRVIQARTDEELHTAARLRYQVFIEEMGQDYAGATSAAGLADPRDVHGAVFLAYEGDRAVGTMTIDWWGQVELPAEDIEHFGLEGFARAFSPKAIAIIRKATVSRDCRNSAVFMRLVSAVTEFVYSRPEIRFAFLQCASALLPLYERLGFRRYAPAFHNRHTGNDSLPLCQVVGDHQHLSRVCSPLLRLVKKIPCGDHQPALAFLSSLSLS